MTNKAFDALSFTENYFRNVKAPLPDTESELQAREKELSDVLKHLKNERRRIAVFAQLERRLIEYQLQGTQSADENPFDMMLEKHHPTRILARNMRASGRPRPSKRHSPHHIVQGKGKHPDTADTRLNLHIFGIRINDPDNGVWMPMEKADKGHWSMPHAPAHSEIHTYNYETWVNHLIGPLDSEQAIRAALTRIRSLLRDGKQPKQVTDTKDPHWKPTV
jgi:hypothetical protein